MSLLTSRFTPVNISEPACSLTWSSLCIYHIDPDLVTKKLRIDPSMRQKKGVLSTLPSGKIIIGRDDSWILTSEKNIISKDLRTHLDWLLGKVLPMTKQIKELQEQPGALMSIRCSWFSAQGGGGPTLWPEQMEGMANLNLECSLSFADYSE
jgi:hypothetical protein